MLKREDLVITVRVALLFLTLLAASLLLVEGWYVYELVVVPVILFQVVQFYHFHKRARKEIEQFVEAIHYKDFSRHFNVQQAPRDLQLLRQGFNDINTAFRAISKDKETQYQYLQKILELVDTGILSYETESGEVIWMNESLRKLLQVPYLKSIQSLDRRDHQLLTQLIDLGPGSSTISTIHQDKHTIKVLLSATAFQTDNKKYKLIAFQNVNEALDETESKAWQKLLSVMTHEIMNSVAPISSLADTLQHRLRTAASRLSQDDGVIEDLELGIETIRKRSEGLLKFTETYRNLNKITTIHLSNVFISELFGNLHQLMLPTLQQKNIELEIILKDPLLTIQADSNLVEQVLINLVVNAIDAVKSQKHPRISLAAHTHSGKTIIRVADNGTGMPEEVLDKIFVPFFSTKKNGSGIGLSLCKQIMMLHKSSITVQSKEGEGTVFTLQF